MDFKSIGHYEIKEKIGEGVASEVYLGFDVKLDRQVAIKVLDLKHITSEKIKELFLKEAKIIARLNHPNIITIYDYSGDDSPILYLVMEYAPNGSLAKYLKTKNIPVEVGVAIVVGVLDAISHARKSNILHLDIKPENVLLSKDYRIKLTDFGISKIKESEEKEASTSIMGTPAYMSPEQIRGENLDFRSDIFSAGILLCELTSGKHPFKGKNISETLKNISEGKRVSDRRENSIYGELETIIDKALKLEKSDRYQDSDFFIQDLNKILTAINIYDSEKLIEEYFIDHQRVASNLRKKRIKYLLDYGKQKLVTDRVKALDAFNKVLAIDLENKEVLTLLKKKRKGRLVVRLFIYLFAILMFVGFFFFLTEKKIEEPRDITQKDKEGALIKSVEKDFGYLGIVTRPWAKVFIDGKLMGTTPIAEKIKLSVGEHRLKLENPLCEPYESSIGIKKDETALERIELKFRNSQLIFEIEEGIIVYVDENKILDKKALDVKYGKHRVTLIKDDEKIYEADINLNPGEKKVIQWPVY